MVVQKVVSQHQKEEPELNSFVMTAQYHFSNEPKNLILIFILKSSAVEASTNVKKLTTNFECT